MQSAWSADKVFIKCERENPRFKSWDESVELLRFVESGRGINAREKFDECVDTELLNRTLLEVDKNVFMN